MAFCKGGNSAIKEFLNKLDGVEPILEKVVDFTGKVKELRDNPTVEMIDDLIPDDTSLQGYFNLALNALTGTAEVVGNIAQKLSDLLKDKTQLAKNANLFKLASVATGMAHQAETREKHSESFYDTAVQVHIEGLK